MHLLFDLDGTLANSRTGIVRCFQHALGALGVGIPADEALDRYIGSTLPIRACFAELLGTTDATLADRAVALYRGRFETVGMFENVLYPGTDDALAALSARGHILHLVTAKPLVYAREIVRNFGIASYFTSVTGPGLDETRFTKAMLIRRALVECRAITANVVVIGDRAADVDGARENGLPSIAVTWGYGDRAELEGADRTVDSWAALLACLPPELASSATAPEHHGISACDESSGR